MVASRITLIGLDGAGLPLIERGCNAGELPGFSALMKDGAWGELLSTIPPISPTAWTSIFTGVNPGKHGIFGFVKRRAESYFPRPISSADVRVPPLWRLLSDHGINSAWVSIPFTYPPEPIRGVLVTGLGTPSKKSNFVHPPEFKEEILRKHPEFDVDFGEDRIELTRNIERSLPKIEKVTEASIELFKDFRSDERYHLVCAVFRALDVLQHYVHDHEFLLSYLRRFDQLVQYCNETMAHNEVLFVCSDHGFRDVHTSFRMNNWLQGIGKLRLKGKPVLGSLGIRAETFQKLLVSLGLKGLVWKIKRSSLAESVLRLVPSEDSLSNDVDWRETEAYYIGNEGGAIFLNIKGREPTGVVQRGQRYQEVVNTIVAQILKTTDPRTGRMPVARAYRNSEVYSGALDDAPDILFLENDGYTISGGYDYSGKCFSEVKYKRGDHSMKGILFVAGNNVAGQQRLGGATVYDVAPTILHILGIPIPRHFDGKVLTQLFETDNKIRDLPEIRHGPRENETDRISRVVSRLRKSGEL